MAGAADTALNAVPACEDDVTATLTDGVRVRYDGADARDPQTCLMSWNGRTYRYLAGFWGGGRFRRGTPAEREAISRALTGPVGTTTSFDDARAELWGKVTVEHVANPVLTLRTGPRRTVQLRVVRHDARGRPDVRRITLHWIDMTSGITLKRQTVTHMPDGQRQAFTTWQVDRLDGAVL